MKDRIIEFLRKENKSAAQLAEEIGVQPSGISHILSGRNKPSLDFVLKMLDKYSYLSTEWLLLGRGSMYREPSETDLFSEQIISAADNESVDKQTNDVSGKADEDKPSDSEGKYRRIERKSEKIVWFFTDNTFREFIPEPE